MSTSSDSTNVDYVELAARSHFSLLEGASSPQELARRAAELGMSALGIVDRQGLYGAVKHARACSAEGLRPIFGAVLEVRDAAPERHGQASAPTATAAGASGGGDGGQSVSGRTEDALPSGDVTLLVENARGWASLCRLISDAGRGGTKHERPASWSLLARHAAGLICVIGGRGDVVVEAARRGDRDATLRAAKQLVSIFGRPRTYVALERHLEDGDRRVGATMEALAGHLGLELVATNGVRYATPDGFRLQQVLTGIRRLETLDEAAAKGALLATPHRHLKDGAAMRALFPDHPQAVAAAARLASRCRFELDLSHARLPRFPTREGESAFGRMYELCHQGLKERYRPVTPEAAQQLARELGIIERLGLADYFLVVHDIAAFARHEGIPAQGRGSAAGSLVAYTLGITPVDPLAHGLLFERFLSEASNATPDIDIDFAADRREEVIQYVYRRWGADHTAMVANVVTFRARSAVADVGKALGFPADMLREVRRHLHTRAAADVAVDLGEVEPFRKKLERLPWRQLVDLCTAIDRFPRHLSIHTGGMLVTSEPLCDIAPLEPATMEGRVVVQWDKDDVEDAGLIKIDLLSLRTLGLVGECFELVAQGDGPELSFETVPQDCPDTWAMIRAADTIGCFQIESRAQLALMPRLQAKEMEDLVVAVSLIRPGPIEGGMARAYLRRRFGEEPVSYWHPSLEPILEETLGILVYQEQVLRVAMTLSGFSGAQADGLRRSMSRKRGLEALERWRADFVAGAEARGVEGDVAHHVFDHLRGFASYGFCKSHAAAFARLTWVTAWLKQHHALPFYTAMLNAQPMGFYTVEAVVEDARRHGIALHPVHINRSTARWTMEDGALRVPFSRVKGLGEEVAEALTAERERRGPYRSLWDLVRRARPPRHLAERLIRAGALDGLPVRAAGDAGRGERGRGEEGDGRRGQEEGRKGRREARAGARGTASPDDGRPPSQSDDPALDADRRDRPADQDAGGPDRRQLLWALGEMRVQEGDLALPPVVVRAPLPATGPLEEVLADYALVGVAQGAHVMALLRPAMADQGATTCEALGALPHGAPARVAGRLEVLQRPQTAKGIVFATLEDETGMANLVLYPDIFEDHRQVVRDHAVLVADGRVQQEQGVTHLIVRRLRGIRVEGEAAGEASAAIGPKWGTSGPGVAHAHPRGALGDPGKEFE